MKPSIIKIRHRYTPIAGNAWEIVEKKWYGYEIIFRHYSNNFEMIKRVFTDLLSLPFYKSEEELYKK